MKTKIVLLFIGALTLIASPVKSQVWHFGQNCGLDFSGGGDPVTLAGGQTFTQEGVAVQYECNGDLLFYSDGTNVWDASHNVIPGGPLAGISSMAQVLAVPKPGTNGNSYYIFYGIPPSAVNGADIMWAELDMSGPTIVSKDNALPTIGGDIFFEGMTLVAHSNGTDYWLVTHDGNSARWDIYLITSTGIAWNRQESIGSAFSAYSSSHLGYMATSKNNDRIAYAMAKEGKVEVFSFNNSNGDITGKLRTWSWGDLGWVYGIDFSPDGQNVYISKRAGVDTGIWKGRIPDGSLQFIFDAGFATGAVRRGPNDKLYFVQINVPQLGVINDPDNYDTPDLNANSLSMAPGMPKDGLPTLPIDCFNLCHSYNQFNDTFCTSYTSPSGNYTWTSGGTYKDTIPNAAGCDSIITIILTKDFTSNTINESFCTSYTSPSGNYTWTSGGTYKDTIPNAAGCDSIITIILSDNKTYSTINEIHCNTYTSPSGNYTWTNSGTYKDTILNVAGCDSIITINLTINNSNTGTDVITACDSYTWIDGIPYTSSNNTATYTLNNVDGCDSVVTLDLTMNYSNTGTDVITAIDNYTWIDGIPYTSSNNVATYTLTNIDGCDSLVTLDLTINSSVGINEVSFGDEFKIYPNPTNSDLTIEMGNFDNDLTISILDYTGKEVKTISNISNPKIEVSLNDLSNGFYSVVFTNKKETRVLKLIKQ